ncbi:MAG: hypothetical protein H6757_02175 [Candidatus Omnitrophica bacterium]|nr:hypothetical protein [Candidatus Omnitrophota bacterium]
MEKFLNDRSHGKDIPVDQEHNPAQCHELLQEIRKKQDEFLDVYSFYLKSGIVWIRDQVYLKAYELGRLDPTFRFDK